MSAPTPAHHPIVWPDPSPLQQWWARVMGSTAPDVLSGDTVATCNLRPRPEARRARPGNDRTDAAPFDSKSVLDGPGHAAQRGSPI